MKKKKKKQLTKKEKTILICLGTLAFLLILGIAMLPTKTKKIQKENTSQEDLSQNLTSIEEIVTYLEATFISTEDSKQGGYEKDINVSFKYNLYENEESKEKYFTNFYEKIAKALKFKSFRIIDKSKSITIEVKCSGRRNNRSTNKWRKRIF